ncbi:hypothetical protein OIU78_022814 [Salix suchowensis]|nr:hypothetical protein OIU78_022814 [Salix suchowensis]
MENSCIESLSLIISRERWRKIDVEMKMAATGNLSSVTRNSLVISSGAATRDFPQLNCCPRNEVMGGYIFVCNNETMQEDLRRQLFGLPHKYRDSVRAITPGLPLFLYNYTCHQLHGVFQVCLAR